MKMYFHIENKDFSHYLKLTANGKVYYFCDDLTVNVDDREILDIDIEFIRVDDYLKIEKNIFLRVLLTLVKCIFSPLLFFIDNNDGIRMDNGYDSFNPFTLKKSFSVAVPDEKVVNIKYIDSKYNKVTKKYSYPIIELKGDGVIDKTEEMKFSDDILKNEWKVYHIPAYIVIMIVILLLNILNFSIFAKVIGEIPLYQLSENIGAIIGMSFCSFVLVGLFIVWIIIVVKSHKLQREVISKNM